MVSVTASDKSGRKLTLCKATYTTIVHPSVYFLTDVYSRMGIDQALKHFTADLQAFRESSLISKGLDPWTTERQFRTADFKQLKAFRILVCGRAGIGKSTLINRMFGKTLVRASSPPTNSRNQD
jgi:ribosome biogenesis GTPase A